MRHIKQVSGEPQATQINLLHHQRTELPQNRYKKKRSHTKPRLGNNKPHGHEQYQGQILHRNKGDHKPPTSSRLIPSNNFNRCSKCRDTAHHEGFTCPAKKYQCKACHKLGHFTSQCFQRKQHSQHKYRRLKVHQIQADKIYDSPDSYPSDVSSSEDSFCLQVKIKHQRDGTQKVPRLTHLITNIAYWLKQHHTRNQYLHARIDTGVEVNLMPVSVYKLIYHDHDLMTPSQLKIGTYTTDTVKILGTCIIYLVHPDSKKLTETIFYIASNEGSILLSCNTSLTLGLIHSWPRLNYLPLKASLITSNADHPRKTKAQIQTQKQEITVHTTNQQQDTQVTTITVPKLVTSQDQIMHQYPDVFEGIGKFPGPPYHIHVDPSVTPKQTPVDLYQFILKMLFKKKSARCCRTEY